MLRCGSCTLHHPESETREHFDQITMRRDVQAYLKSKVLIVNIITVVKKSIYNTCQIDNFTNVFCLSILGNSNVTSRESSMLFSIQCINPVKIMIYN